MGAPRKPQVVLEGMEDEGGINIEIARQRMQEEDKLDKQRYREMIKKRHKVSDAPCCFLYTSYSRGCSYEQKMAYRITPHTTRTP